MRVPLFATREAVEPVMPEIALRVQAALESGRYILGEEVSSFESEFAEYLGVEHCVGVNSGTDALVIGLRALGIKPGDEVVVPAASFFATAEAVVNVGARPVFADVGDGTWCLSAETIEPVLTDATRAIVPVHLFGNPAPMNGLNALARERGVAVIEDAAQAAGAGYHGRKAGALADVAAFSFFPSKNLPGVGDGGALVTDDPEIAETARLLRHHGSTDKEVHTDVGYNSRLDELQAAALRAALPQLDGWNAARRAAAAEYARSGLGEVVELPAESEGAESCFHLYVIATGERDRLREALEAEEIGCRAYYTTPLYRQPALRDFAPPDPLPNTERFARQGLALPMGPALGTEQIGAVASAASRAFATPAT